MSDTKVIVDCATGEVSTVNLTTEEIADRDQAAAEFLERQATEAAAAEALAALKASARAKLIAGTALTAEEAAVLVI
jgi:hypothetical protein